MPLIVAGDGESASARIRAADMGQGRAASQSRHRVLSEGPRSSTLLSIGSFSIWTCGLSTGTADAGRERSPRGAGRPVPLHHLYSAHHRRRTGCTLSTSSSLLSLSISLSLISMSINASPTPFSVPFNCTIYHRLRHTNAFQSPRMSEREST
jgi:hypothetical protein